MKRLRLAGISVAALIASCAIIPPPPVSDNSAVVGLVDVARADVDAGRIPNAVSSLERALRIEPKNPRLWQELARVRLKEGDYAQAENLAARSNSWVGNDNALRAENWRLIAESRAARGDDAGAKAALERARQADR